MKILPEVSVLGLASSCLLLHIMLRKRVSAELDTFGYCIKTTPSAGLLQCAGQQALASLQFLEETSNVSLANGLLMLKDETNPAARILPNFVDHDPLDFR